MRKIFQSTLLLVALATPAVAAPASEFYLTLLRRGMSDVEAGRNAEAVTNLRLAAFGLLDSIESYETAQAYLAVALDRSQQAEQAAEAARRIVAAEKIEKKFRSIVLPPSIRAAFETVAKKSLPVSDAAALAGGATATATAPPVVVDRVDVVTEKRPGTVPKPETAAPAKTESRSSKEPAPKPQPEPPPPPKTPAAVAPPKSGAAPKATPDQAAQFTAAERALAVANINDARRIYRELLSLPSLTRVGLLRLAEGLYRSRDFANTLLAFDRAGSLRS